MTRINNIALFRFKNHPDSVFSFPTRVTGITGKNGSGKTNLLDALYYLCFARSYFAYTDASLVTLGQQGFRISGSFEKVEETPVTVSCILRETGSKELHVGDQVCKKLSAYIGRFSCVMIAPDDIEIINSTGGTLRRRYLDTILCQTDTDYLNALQKYNKILLQRNSLLRDMHRDGVKDMELLDVYDAQLTEAGNIIFEGRKKLSAALEPLVMEQYQALAGAADNITITYKSQLQETSFATLLLQQRHRDMAAQRTGSGIHKDDIELNMLGTPLRLSASQGQKKSVLLALKLTELKLLKEHLGSTPILLLDDMFERLDQERISRLLQLVTGKDGGQVFITDTNEAQLRKHLETFTTDFAIISLPPTGSFGQEGAEDR